MHLEIRKVRGVSKYYLSHSFREGKQVRKIRRYLGENLNPQELVKRRKQAEAAFQEQLRIYNQIKDPLKTVLATEEVKNLTISTGDSIPKLKVSHLNEKGWKAFTETFTFDTNAIEGATLSKKAVKGILERELWPKNASKDDISETYGVANAINHIRQTKDHMSLSLIKKIHLIVFKNSKAFAGKFRGKGVEVVIKGRDGRIVHTGAPSAQMVSLLRELVIWYNENRNRYHPIVLAAVVHNQFETIHPFQDGNGRVGRILLNNILLKHNMPPVNIALKRRAEYYHALLSYQKNGKLRPMVELILREYRAKAIPPR